MSKDAPDWIRFLYCDLSGIVRGKATYKYSAKKILDGVALNRGILALNFADQMQSYDEFGAVGDIRLRPDSERYINIGHPENTGVILCDIVQEDGSDFECCPRSILKQQVEKARKAGLYFEAAFEPEFYVLRRDAADQITPIDRSRAFSSEGMNEAAQLIDAFASALTTAGMTVEQYNAEHGHGQHELSVRHTQPVQAADNHVLYREILRSQATIQGLIASLSPKPFHDTAGSGCHVHLSVWDLKTKTNALVANGELSDLARSFIGGVLEHLPAIVAFGCTCANSYDRIQPQSASSAFSCWGHRNREAAIRVPPPIHSDANASTNLEIRFVDNSCNPYLFLAAVIASGLSGIERKIAAPKPVDFDPSSVDAQTLKKLKVHRLPFSLMDAVNALDHDPFMHETFGEKFMQLYCRIKRSEHDHYAPMSFDERSWHHLTAF
jgi:glutamine synthetase